LQTFWKDHASDTNFASDQAAFMKKLPLAALLTFNSGFVDAVGFFGLQGLFAAHVTGNFVTMGSTLVFGTQGIIGKVLVLPEFAVLVILTRWAGLYLTARKKPILRPLLSFDLLFLIGFFILANVYGPFSDADSPAALAASFTAVAAMAILNGLQRVYLNDVPPVTIMTGNVTQAALDAADLIRNIEPDQKAVVRLRFIRTVNGIVFFALGCATAILLHFHIGFWDLSVPVAIGIVCVIMGRD
jgi:uncharacterized membrane protein YoaK (UPF0700 family)